MRAIITLAAISFATAVPAMAQTADSAAATPPSSSAPAATSSGAASTSASVAVGQPVKDKTGAIIGQVSKVTPDASGKQVATIQMGADSFAVDTSSLAVDKGTVLINASQAELQGMLKK